jgi:hypothetical protein
MVSLLESGVTAGSKMAQRDMPSSGILMRDEPRPVAPHDFAAPICEGFAFERHRVALDGFLSHGQAPIGVAPESPDPRRFRYAPA